MSDACYCDYDGYWAFHSVETRTARKQHRCVACRAHIQPGEKYEYVAGKWEGDLCTYKTCVRCVAVREYVQAHVPCFCWSYQGLLEHADETVREFAWQVPGMGMEYGRLRVAILKAKRDIEGTRAQAVVTTKENEERSGLTVRRSTD